MRVSLHKKFKKQFKKLPMHIQKKFYERVGILVVSPYDPLLNVHRLAGDMTVFFSMNVTGDYPALFTQVGQDIVFQKIGTHSELYS